MSIRESAVARHYRVGDLAGRILDRLKATGKDPARMTIDDLAIIDEFHVGGRKATEYAISKLPLSEDRHVLDIGCGIGGAARTIAGVTGCRVTGIDLTPDFIDTARTLTHLTGLEDKVAYQIASALSMPFEAEAFDAALTMHVTMNIEDRDGLYGEIARVIKPGATFVIYDVMKKGDTTIAFPVPWAETAKTSHLTTPDEMTLLLEQAGFEIREIEDRTEFAAQFFRERLAAAKDGPSPLGPQLIMGANAREKLQNTQRNLESGRIATVQIIADRK